MRFAFAFLWASAALAGEPLASFTAAERLGVDWPRTLVTYRAELPAGKPVRLLDAAGQEVPVQLSGNSRVSFFAELPKDGRYSYTLVAGTPKTRSRVRASKTRDGLLLENGKTAVRLPVAGMKGVPGPVLGVRLLDGTWTAAARFECAPKVTGWTSAITASGPLFAEAQVRYTFDNGAHYTLVARVLADEAAVRFDEQMDFKTIRRQRDWQVVFPLTDDGGRFQPDVTWWSTPEGRFFRANETFEAAAEKAGFATLPARRRHLGSMSFTSAATNQTLLSLAAWYPYAPVAYYAALTEMQRMGTGPFVGVMPMHAGNWRGMPESSNGDLLSLPGGRVAMAWPLTVSPHPNSLLHTGEFDPALPYTFIRRQWALLAGPMQYHDSLLAFRRYEGYINLDDYKDWVLDWPADESVTYPRVAVTREQVAKMDLATHPLAGELKKLLYFSDDETRAGRLWKELASDNYWVSPRGHALRCLGRDAQNQAGTGWVAGFRHSQKAAWAHAADELLSSRHLTDDQRAKLRAWIAACCYALTEPDFNPRGTMVHLGNPNMPMNRFFGLTFAAALIPDHPEAANWLRVSQEYLRYKLARNTAPGGGWSELLTYYMSAASHVMQAALVLDNAGLLDDHTAALAAQAGSFPLWLVAPHDPRFGARSLPAWGHEGYYMIPTQWLPVAAFMRRRDPELARALVWTWDQLGQPQEDHHDAGFSPRTIMHADLLNEARVVPTNQLASRWIPGFGATMRAHLGDRNETFLAYRQGYMVSHSDANQGDFIIHAKGAPLTTLSLFGYALYNNQPFQKLSEEFGWHNRVRFGSVTNNGGWPGGGMISGVHAFRASESVDYLRGVGDYPPQRWTRQIMFLKSPHPTGPNYFVLRDSFTGDALEPKWWSLRTGGPVVTNAAGFNYASAFGAKLDVHFLEPARVTLESRQATQQGPIYNRAGMLWKKAGNKLEGQNGEETMTVTRAGPIPAGQDILVALYPQTASEALPEYHVLAPGVARIVTSEGTDYVFFADYRDDNVEFRGRAGVVRVSGGDARLMIAEGPGEIRYRGKTLKSDTPATDVPALVATEKVWGDPGPCEVKFEPDRITGRTAGEGRFIYVARPPGLNRLPVLVVDGQTYAPGSSADFARGNIATTGDPYNPDGRGGPVIVPLLPGEHQFELKALAQPPVFRNWQAWPDPEGDP